MTHKRLLFGSDAQTKILRGATQLADAVRVTLGPKSKSVLIGRKWGSPLVCNDGVTIAKELDLPDPDENLGVLVIRQAAERTGDAVGDGTTTSTLLAHAIFAEGLRNVTAGASAIDLKRGLDRGLVAAVKIIRGLSRPVGDRKEKVQIATISAHNDDAIGALVGDAVDTVGGDGVILRKALEIPARQIALNSGVDAGVVVDRMKAGTGSYGFDAAKAKYVDLVAAGIIDPTKVVRVALENAVSVAGTLLLTDATMTDLPEPEAKGPSTMQE